MFNIEKYTTIQVTIKIAKNCIGTNICKIINSIGRWNRKIYNFSLTTEHNSNLYRCFYFKCLVSKHLEFWWFESVFNVVYDVFTFTLNCFVHVFFFLCWHQTNFCKMKVCTEKKCSLIERTVVDINNKRFECFLFLFLSC